MKRIIAGYTAAPADRTAAMLYYEKLVQVHEADGLEFAWAGPQTSAHLDDMLKLLPPTWTITLNDIPATYRACVQQPTFGLASPDEAGRAAAMNMLREIQAAIKALNDKAGRKVVLALEFHCAPGFDKRVVDGSAAALARSLAEAAAIDWDGCAVMLEHCDAFLAGQKPAKGFLHLHHEIEALKSVTGSPVGLSLNWGRSLIEVRKPERVIEHVKSAAASGLLKAYTFSGTAGVKNSYGEAWADSHLPFGATDAGIYSEPASMMSTAHVGPVLDYLDGCIFLAIKTNWQASRTDPTERAQSVIGNFHALSGAIKQRRGKPVKTSA